MGEVMEKLAKNLKFQDNVYNILPIFAIKTGVRKAVHRHVMILIRTVRMVLVWSHQNLREVFKATFLHMSTYKRLETGWSSLNYREIWQNEHLRSQIIHGDDLNPKSMYNYDDVYRVLELCNGSAMADTEEDYFLYLEKFLSARSRKRLYKFIRSKHTFAPINTLLQFNGDANRHDEIDGNTGIWDL
ncbi:hypothetical protein Fcan01_26976 [Folsomia candida]|uniref:Uncharacterized protein n=1 Tax=Folsomia candida TaxID=158441 RepID=A0A226D042_FOLCA|nr:hypothetical protein Fcan01_26976 [Folsomia candida]